MKWDCIKYLYIRKEDVSQFFQHNLDDMDYRVPPSMCMELQTAFDSKLINEFFKNARNIAKKAAKKIILLANASSVHFHGDNIEIFRRND
ncbi:hypothetical protein ACLNAL_28405 [Bacillus sp. AF62]|uniref:hypothetical protein n=1 Tax=Bacillus TaxID=1386 RepID=UPI0018CCF21D|nr:hypothetical protein [Bacillus thuringiensis]MBG9503144.1 hypothetical protein [Bacillus thuringiensis]